MAGMKANHPIQILDDDDGAFEDVSFLAELEAAEAEAISLSATKRRRVTLPASSDVQEGAYTAALKGSRSMTWNQNRSSGVAAAAESTPRAVVGGGACFKCGMEGHWARDCGVSSSVSAASMTVRGGESEKACPCGAGSCLLLTANTERNRGRKFFKCPLRQENGNCGFFEWCDEPTGDQTSAQKRPWMDGRQQDMYQHPANKGTTGVTRSWDEYDKGTSASNSGYGTPQKFESSDSKGYGMRTGSSCFKCGEEGHWARDCPTTSSNAIGGATGKSSSNTCFKCGESGHWAKDCSQGQSTNVRYK